MILLFAVAYTQSAAQKDNSADSSKIAKPFDHKAQIDIGADFNKFAGRGIIGLHLGLKADINNVYSTGLNIEVTSNSINDDFGANIPRPILSVMSLGWINQFSLISNDMLRMGTLINLAYMGAALEDPDQKVRRWSKSGYHNYPKVIKSNNYLDFDPGVFISLHLASSTWFTAMYKYRLLIGGDEFANQSDFSGSMAVACLTFIFSTNKAIKPKK